MDIEQLKLVLEMVDTATEGAMWFAFAWLAKGFITSLIGYGLAGFVVYRLSHMVVNLVGSHGALYSMRSTDPGISDSMAYGAFLPDEISKIISTHRRGCEAILAERNAK